MYLCVCVCVYVVHSECDEYILTSALRMSQEAPYHSSLRLDESSLLSSSQLCPSTSETEISLHSKYHTAHQYIATVCVSVFLGEFG